jgi:hypothetical protein
MCALRRTEVKEVVVNGFHHTVQQGARSFVLDCPLVMTDWTLQARALAVPTHIILGANDWACRPQDAHSFTRMVPRIGLTMVDDAGMYVLYTHWPRVFERLEALLAPNAERRLRDQTPYRYGAGGTRPRAEARHQRVR